VYGSREGLLTEVGEALVRRRRLLITVQVAEVGVILGSVALKKREDNRMVRLTERPLPARPTR